MTIEQFAPRIATRLWVGIYLIASFGSATLLKYGLLPAWLGTTLFLCSFLILIPLVRSAERAQAACGFASKAMRTYNRRVLIAAMTYVVALFSGIGLVRYFDPPAVVRVSIAIAVALPVIFMIRAMALLLREESDEYLRVRLIEQSLIATGFLLTVATLYGFLNTFDLAPRLDAWTAVPLWACGLAIGRLFRKDPSC